jgi:CheY-like chemotaxis protein
MSKTFCDFIDSENNYNYTLGYEDISRYDIMRMLIAEDNRASRVLLEKLLMLEGHEVASAANGEEALASFEERKPDMVFVDWMMPKMDGLQLTKRIRELDGSPSKRVYIIMVTAKSEKEDMLTALEAGVDDFIVKPYDRSVLISRIKIGERLRMRKTTDTMHILAEEHETLLRMAKVLESISKLLGRMEVPSKILEWCGSTAMVLDMKTHHQKENYYIMLFLDKALKAHGENPKTKIFSKASLKQVENEHHEMESLLKELNAGFLALSAGNKSGIEGLKDLISRYVGIQRKHLTMEENVFFPFTYKYLDEDDQGELLHKFDEIDRSVGIENLELRKKQIARAEEILKIKK